MHDVSCGFWAVATIRERYGNIAWLLQLPEGLLPKLLV